jgi:hypothetical protein
MELQSQERAHRQRLRDLSADEDADIEKHRSQLGQKVCGVWRDFISIVLNSRNNIVLNCIVLCSIVLYSVVLHCIVLYCTM